MNNTNKKWVQRMMWIAWPAFLVAGMFEFMVFAFVDPEDLHWFGQPMALSRQGVYTVAFFAFWALTMLSSGLTTVLAASSYEVNCSDVPEGEQPKVCVQDGR